MKFAIITHVVHIRENNQYFGYGPYVREMNIWLKYVDEVIIIAPVIKQNTSPIDLAYKHDLIIFKRVPNFNFIGVGNIFRTLFKMPIILWNIFWAMKKADHIHLRCPGNMGLLGCLVQILFPNKIKTAKYAGNWDPKSKQPWSYRLQKWILSNTFLTRNMQVLVYGNREKTTKNIKPFFTATYSDNEKLPLNSVDLKQKINFVFVGTLSSGKNPLYAIQLVETLIKKGHDAKLDLYGEGIERSVLENYIVEKELNDCVFLNGNQSKEVIINAYQKSHFVILPSKSEGWPKVIAEGMFWGCIPIATRVSCVPFMLDFGKRGVLLELDFNKDLAQIEEIINDKSVFIAKRTLAHKWSQQYTTDVFEAEIKKLLIK